MDAGRFRYDGSVEEVVISDPAKPHKGTQSTRRPYRIEDDLQDSCTIVFLPPDGGRLPVFFATADRFAVIGHTPADRAEFERVR